MPFGVDENGAARSEYALIVEDIAIAMIAGHTAIGVEFARPFSSLATP
jgi:Flp pilus assembly pilin Flp